MTTQRWLIGIALVAVVCGIGGWWIGYESGKKTAMAAVPMEVPAVLADDSPLMVAANGRAAQTKSRIEEWSAAAKKLDQAGYTKEKMDEVRDHFIDYQLAQDKGGASGAEGMKAAGIDAKTIMLLTR